MESDTSKIFGLTIKHYRTNLNISQEELAEKCGFHRTYVGQIERGERNPSLKSIAVFANVFKQNLSSIFKKYEEIMILSKEKQNG